MFEKFKKELAKAQKQQEIYKTKPNSPEAKALARRGAVGLIVIGLLLLGGAWLEWTYSDTIHFVLPVSGVLLPLFGLKILITGKMPVK